MMWRPHLYIGLQNRAMFSLVLDSLALPALEDTVEKIRFIDEGHGIHHGELTVSVFAGCRGVI